MHALAAAAAMRAPTSTSVARARRIYGPTAPAEPREAPPALSLLRRALFRDFDVPGGFVQRPRARVVRGRLGDGARRLRELHLHVQEGLQLRAHVRRDS